MVTSKCYPAIVVSKKELVTLCLGFNKKINMENTKIKYTCFICGTSFQFGPNIYNGKQINSYNIIVCKKCYENNSDGWSPSCEEKLLIHLKEQNFELPKKNSSGLLPRE